MDNAIVQVAQPISCSQPAVRQAETDEQLIQLWLHGRGKGTTTVYRSDIDAFLAFAAKPLHQITLGHVQAFADELEQRGLRPATRNRKLSVVKSLFAFGHKIGYLTFDVARPVRAVKEKDRLVERILDEGQVQRMLALESHPRNHVLLTLLYAAGLRVSELCLLKWSDLQSRDGAGGQITVFGKGQKTRHILLPLTVWTKLLSLRAAAPDAAPVFRSRKKGHLCPAQVWRIVRKAAVRAGIEKEVSCHWLRHAHASHSLDRGAAISLVQATLGHSSVASTGRYLHARPNDSSANYLRL